MSDKHILNKSSDGNAVCVVHEDIVCINHGGILIPLTQFLYSSGEEAQISVIRELAEQMISEWNPAAPATPDRYCYTTFNGSTVFSPTRLTYALTPQCYLNLKKVRDTDRNGLTLISDAYLAEAMDEARWAELDSWFSHCRKQDGTIYIRDGGYKPLNELLTKLTSDERMLIIARMAILIVVNQLRVAGWRRSA